MVAEKPVVAVDIGGTKIMTAVFSPDGRLLAKEVRPTLAGEGIDLVVRRLISAVAGILESNNLKPTQLDAICVACAGGIDTGRGVVETPSPHLPDWAGLSLADILKKRFKVATYLINDASAAALGEQRFGAGKGVQNLVLFTLGTGIGGGIIIDGKVYLGARGGAGEIGHITVEADGPKCGCGNIGCLEMFASGSAIARDAIERIRKGEKSSLVTTVRGEIDSITTEAVVKAARKGDKLAREVIARAAHYLGIGMVNTVNIFDPEMLVFGGGMSGLGEMMLAPGRKMVAQQAFSRSARTTKIVVAQLGNEAGVYGAAAFALEMIRRTG